jgi:hypothetical protein
MGHSRPNLDLDVDAARLDAFESDCGGPGEHGSTPVSGLFLL